MSRPFNTLMMLNRLNFYADDELQYHLGLLSVDELDSLANHQWTSARILKEVTKLIAEKNAAASSNSSISN